MREEVVLLQTAKLAKILGFKEKTDELYLGDELIESFIEGDMDGFYNFSAHEIGDNWNNNWVYDKDLSKCFGCKIDNERYFEATSAPTQSLLSRWIRENHNIVCSVYSNASGYIWEIHYDKTRGGTHIKYSDMRGDCKSSGTFTTYELAMEDCLLETLRGLKYGKF